MTTTGRAEIRTALRETSSDLLAYLERRVRSRDDAADLLGETMLQTWRRIDAFPLDNPERQPMWLFTIAANVLANHNRSRRMALTERLRTLDDCQPNQTPDVAETNAIRDAVLRLHDAQR